MEESWLDDIALRIRPQIRETSGLERSSQMLDTSGLILALPLALIGIFWLIWSTDLNSLREQWIGLAVILVLLAIFSRYTFELRLQLTKTQFATNAGSLILLVAWSGALMFGPIAIWPHILLNTGIYANRWRREISASNRWNIGRNYAQELSYMTIGPLMGLAVYQWLGGPYPLPGLSWHAVGPAILASLVYFLTALILFLPFAWRIVNAITVPQIDGVVASSSMLRFLLVGLCLNYLSLPFAVLGAGLFGAYGPGIYLFFVAGAFLASLLASRLSRSDRYSQQRSRELVKLETLGRAIIDTPPDTSTALPQLLAEHLEGMFPRSLTYIWLYPDTTLYLSDDISVADFPQLEETLTLAERGTEPYYQISGIRLPDESVGNLTQNGLIVPIVDRDGEGQGGVLVLKREDYGDVLDYLAAVRSLAAQIASALHRIEVYKQKVESEKMAHELEVAGQIQASFLPAEVPSLAGWDLWATLEPARQTSGDFYDFVELDDGRLGILIADVSDKGTAAALYMALSRTLIRTYAKQYPGNPELALQTANERLMEDTGSDQFVTVFFAALDPATGTLLYANAGHNPAYLFGDGSQAAPRELSHTGIPLGMFGGMDWRQDRVTMNAGDLLVLYTDGITEAQDDSGEQFGENRLRELITESRQRGHTAQDSGAQLLDCLNEFAADTSQFDDITLLILRRVS